MTSDSKTEPAMDFSAGDGVLRNTSYCRSCHARVQERADHTKDCSSCFGTYDHVIPRVFDPVSTKAGVASEECPCAEPGRTSHGGVYTVVTWTNA